MEKQLIKYKYSQPKAVVIALKTREVIASSPEMQFYMNQYDEEEW